MTLVLTLIGLIIVMVFIIGIIAAYENERRSRKAHNNRAIFPDKLPTPEERNVGRYAPVTTATKVTATTKKRRDPSSSRNDDYSDALLLSLTFNDLPTSASISSSDTYSSGGGDFGGAGASGGWDSGSSGGDFGGGCDGGGGGCD